MGNERDHKIKSMNQKGFIHIVLIIIAAALVGAGVYFVAMRQTIPPMPSSSPSLMPMSSPTVTPTQKPNPTPTSIPSPAPTPSAVPSGEKIIRKAGEQESSFLIQKINFDSVEGLWYQAYPVARGEGEPKTIYVGDDIGYTCEGVSEKLIHINFSGQTVTFNKLVGQASLGGCPICLAGNSLIATPSGSVLVKDLQVGMAVWTMDKTGHRALGVLIKTSKVFVSPSHQMVHLVLHDGRELFVSSGHPTIDGHRVGDLMQGDLYDGVSVIRVELVSYGENATYDILPSGDTGFYWASGILIGSTLR